MSESRKMQPPPPVIRDRIRDDDSRIIERVVVLLLAFWLGGLLMVVMSAAGSFEAVKSVMDKPPSAVNDAMAKLGPAQTREILRIQSGEVNGHLFVFWGWVQLGLTGAALAALLFLTNAGKPVLALGVALSGLSAAMALYLIPVMQRMAREMISQTHSQDQGLRVSFQNMHRAFGAMEGLSVVLGLAMIVLLLRSRPRPA